MPVVRIEYQALRGTVKQIVLFHVAIVYRDNATPLNANDCMAGMIVPVSSTEAFDLLDIEYPFQRKGKDVFDMVHNSKVSPYIMDVLQG